MRIKVNNVELNYQKLGSGHPLILLHGNQEDSSIFDKIIAPLALYYTVYAIDARDHGQSQQGVPMNYQLYVEDVAAFIRKLDLRHPYIFGYSDGGIVGLMLASQYTNITQRLMVAGANVNPDGLEKFEQLKYRVINFFQRKPEIDMMLNGPDISDAELRRITAKTLTLVGEKDCVKVEHTRQFSEKIKDSRIVVMPRQTHSSYVVHSLKLLNVMKEFFVEDKDPVAETDQVAEKSV